MTETKDKMADVTTINFSITKCPLKVFKAFSEFCKQETNDNYAFGLKMLLDGMKTNVKEVVLYENLQELKDRVEKLENGKHSNDKN
tara:strand:- start:16369 stop:16626 length:258 start_codon:yes stop_codon:yes gene_type:complete